GDRRGEVAARLGGRGARLYRVLRDVEVPEALAGDRPDEAVAVLEEVRPAGRRDRGVRVVVQEQAPVAVRVLVEPLEERPPVRVRLTVLGVRLQDVWPGPVEDRRDPLVSE